MRCRRVCLSNSLGDMFLFTHEDGANALDGRDVDPRGGVDRASEELHDVLGGEHALGVDVGLVGVPEGPAGDSRPPVDLDSRSCLAREVGVVRVSHEA